MSRDDNWGWHGDLAHYRPEVIDKELTWAGYIGTDTIDGIAERVQQIVKPGRTVILTHSDGFRPAEVKAGLTFYDNSDAIGRGFETWSNDHGGGFRVLLGPGINGFGASFDSFYDHEKGSWLPTGLEVKRRLEGSYYTDRTSWSWAEITGGLPSHGTNPPNDLITIRRQNEHGYREIIQIIPGDMCWQQRHERDAIAAERFASALSAPAEAIDEFHAAHGIEFADRTKAAFVLREMAVQLRDWREPLFRDEAYPHVDGRWL